MVPVFMSRDDFAADCLSAAVASILELPLTAMPQLPPVEDYVRRILTADEVQKIRALNNETAKIEEFRRIWNQQREDATRALVMRDRGRLWADWLERHGLTVEIHEGNPMLKGYSIAINFMRRWDAENRVNIEDAHCRVLLDGVVVHDPNGFDVPWLPKGTSEKMPIQKVIVLRQCLHEG